jgi:uncharacterized RDD family membrane protein YckC
VTESGSSGDPGTPPPPAPPASSWAAAPAVAPVPGTSGLVYADVPNRIIAYIIDAIILGIIGIVVGAILGSIGLTVVKFDVQNGFTYNYLASIIQAVVSAAIGAVYFIYTWTAMRGTLGMKVLGMQVGQAKDGSTLTQEQAIRRWIALGAPFSIAQALNPLPLLGILLGLAALGWVIYLLYTTSQSPTKQGFHDVFAGSAVVKAARSAV